MLTAQLLARGDDIHASRIASTAHSLLADVNARRGDTAAARVHWQHAHDTIARLAATSNDYRLLGPFAVSLLRLDRAEAAAPVLHKLAAMGYKDPLFVQAVASRGSFPPPRAQ